MTLREHYAGLMMQAIISNCNDVHYVNTLLSHSKTREVDINEFISMMAVEQANALIAELAKNKWDDVG